MTREISEIPPDMRKVYRRLRRWRSSHARRVPAFPDALWTAAGELAREHGINRTAKALRLEYGKLKERAGVAGPAKKVVRKVPSTTSGTCGIEENCAAPFASRRAASSGLDCWFGSRSPRPLSSALSGRPFESA